jgi:hypothetical protein
VTLLYVKQAAVFRIGILRRVRLGLDRSQFESKGQNTVLTGA